MSKVVFSKAARSDRREITAYTVRRFGVEQARRLRQTFQAKIASLATAPLTGHRREEFDPPGRSFRYLTVMKSFIIVYEPADDGIRVVRLLHSGRNLARELARDAGENEWRDSDERGAGTPAIVDIVDVCRASRRRWLNGSESISESGGEFFGVVQRRVTAGMTRSRRPLSRTRSRVRTSGTGRGTGTGHEVVPGQTAP